jgi:hypothetical protein
MPDARTMIPRRFMMPLVAALALGTLGYAVADPRPQLPRSEAEHLVPPQGGAVEVPLHAGEVCILSFPEKLAPVALASSADFEIKAWGDDGVAVRANQDKAAVTTLALATTSKQIKVNVTLRVVPKGTPALTMVRFKAASAEEAFEAQVAAAVKARMAPIEAELARVKSDLDGQVRTLADGAIAERLLTRNEIVKLEAHERNDDHVIVHVRRGQLLGDDGYLVFEIENRSRAAYRVASVRVLDGTREVSGPARLASNAIDRDASLVGVVAAGSSARGVVVVRSASSVLGKPLALEIVGPDGRGKIRIDRGLVLR